MSSDGGSDAIDERIDVIREPWTMAKRKKVWTTAIDCAYCGVRVDEPEDEHPFPESWYPPGTPRSEKITVPTCSTCNRASSAVEERVRRHFSLSLDPGHQPASGAMAAAWRSMQPTGDPNQDLHAKNKLASLRASLTVVLASEKERVLSNGTYVRPKWLCDPQSGLFLFGRPGMRFNPDDVTTFIQKLTRGMFWHVFRTPMPASHPFMAPPMVEPLVENAVALLKQLDMPARSVPAPSLLLPVAFEYAWKNTIEDALSSVWVFRIWGRIVMCAMTGKLAEPLLPQV